MTAPDRISIRLEGKDFIPAVRTEAARLGCDPRALCVALLVTVFRSKLVDGVLDGDDPRTLGRHYDMKRPRSSLTMRQQEMMSLLTDTIGKRADRRIEMSYKQISDALNWGSTAQVNRVSKVLVARGMIKMSRDKANKRKTLWTLQEAS